MQVLGLIRIVPPTLRFTTRSNPFRCTVDDIQRIPSSPFSFGDSKRTSNRGSGSSSVDNNTSNSDSNTSSQIIHDVGINSQHAKENPVIVTASLPAASSESPVFQLNDIPRNKSDGKTVSAYTIWKNARGLDHMCNQLRFDLITLPIKLRPTQPS